MKSSRLVIAGFLAAGLLTSGAGAAAADSGNHGAIWTADQHEELDSGSQWGAMIGGLASRGGLKPTGVSEGVHQAKEQSVPGQNK